MVFSFFKKQDNKMPERPAARPRFAEPPPVDVKITQPGDAETAKAAPEPLPDLEFVPAKLLASIPMAALNQPAAAREPAKSVAVADPDFSIDDFDRDFTESSVMGIDVDNDVDPLQACVEQVVVLFANGQDGAARSLLETFVRSYHGSEGKRFWLLLFDLLQITGERAAFEKLGVDYAEACETSPPTWREDSAVPAPAAGGLGPKKVFFQGVLTSEGMEQYHGTTIVSVRRGAIRVALGGDGQVTLGNIVIKARRARCAACTTTASWPASPAARRTRSRCSSASRPSSTSTRATCCARPSNWPRTGAPTASCAAWRPCWRWPTASNVADHHRQRRRARTRAGHRRHRLGRRLRAGRGAGAAREHRPERRERSSSKSLEIAGDICIYTNQSTHRDALETPRRRRRPDEPTSAPPRCWNAAEKS
jgi:hypothetical protein